MSKRISRLATATGLILISVSALSAAPEPPVGSDLRISLDARNVPLGKLLRQFAAVAQVDDLTIDPSLENVLVSVKLDAALPAEAFRAALVDAGADFAIWGKGASLRVVAHAFKAVQLARGASAASAESKRNLEAMSAIDKSHEAIEQQAEIAAQQAQDASEAHADPVAAFLGRGGAPEAPAEAAPSAPVSSPAQAVPLTMPTSSPGNGSAGRPAAPSAAPSDLPSDPFARYLTVMSATTPPKPNNQ